jgi:hypothetical protein
MDPVPEPREPPAAPIDARSWVSRNILSGGQYFADSPEVGLYGTEGARTLETVASITPAARNPAPTEQITN